VLFAEKPGRIVRADGQHRPVDSSRQFADFREMIEVAGVAGVVGGPLAAAHQQRRVLKINALIGNGQKRKVILLMDAQPEP
jgi:hypothetical protein